MWRKYGAGEPFVRNEQHVSAYDANDAVTQARVTIEGGVGKIDFQGHNVSPYQGAVSEGESTITIKIDGKALAEAIKAMERSFALTLLKTEINLYGDDLDKIAVICGDFAKANKGR